MSTAVRNPQHAFGADARSLKDLIEAKERELSELGDYRVSSLEAAVKERDEKLRRLQATIGRLRDDFGYNLKLVEERDVELAAAEEVVRCLEDRLRDSDLRKRELTKDVADRNEKLDRAARALARGRRRGGNASTSKRRSSIKLDGRRRTARASPGKWMLSYDWTTRQN